jgi:hypothetical protein
MRNFPALFSGIEMAAVALNAPVEELLFVRMNPPDELLDDDAPVDEAAAVEELGPAVLLLEELVLLLAVPVELDGADEDELEDDEEDELDEKEEELDAPVDDEDELEEDGAVELDEDDELDGDDDEERPLEDDDVMFAAPLVSPEDELDELVALATPVLEPAVLLELLGSPVEDELLLLLPPVLLLLLLELLVLVDDDPVDDDDDDEDDDDGWAFASRSPLE